MGGRDLLSLGGSRRRESRAQKQVTGHYTGCWMSLYDRILGLRSVVFVCKVLIIQFEVKTRQPMLLVFQVLMMILWVCDDLNCLSFDLKMIRRLDTNALLLVLE